MYFNMNKLTGANITIQGRWHIFKTAMRLKKKYPLLVLDDFEAQTINKELALAILQILENDWYNKKSTIIVKSIAGG